MIKLCKFLRIPTVIRQYREYNKAVGLKRLFISFRHSFYILCIDYFKVFPKKRFKVFNVIDILLKSYRGQRMQGGRGGHPKPTFEPSDYGHGYFITYTSPALHGSRK